MEKPDGAPAARAQDPAMRHHGRLGLEMSENGAELRVLESAAQGSEGANDPVCATRHRCRRRRNRRGRAAGHGCARRDVASRPPIKEAAPARGLGQTAPGAEVRVVAGSGVVVLAAVLLGGGAAAPWKWRRDHRSRQRGREHTHAGFHR